MIKGGYLVDRQEIAYAMNFGLYPVLGLNRENRPFEGDDYCTGDRCRVAWDRKEARYEGMTTHGHVYMENGKCGISNSASCLSASFGYSDVMEDLEEAKAQVVHKGQMVVLVENYPSEKKCTVAVMKVSERIDIHCMKVASIERLTDEEVVAWNKEFKQWQRKTY